VILIEFDEGAGLHAYLRHPAHEAVSTNFRGLLESGWVYDFETGEASKLREFAGLDGEGR
jgi:Stress responsive A/B Barrel Domain